MSYAAYVQTIQYTRSTDVIRPIGGRKRIYVDPDLVSEEEPITGWAPYTHRVVATLLPTSEEDGDWVEDGDFLVTKQEGPTA